MIPPIGFAKNFWRILGNLSSPNPSFSKKQYEERLLTQKNDRTIRAKTAKNQCLQTCIYHVHGTMFEKFEAI